MKKQNNNRRMDRQTLTSSMIPREVLFLLAWSCLSEKRTRLYHARRLVRNVPTRSLSEVMWFSIATINFLDKKAEVHVHISIHIYLIMSSLPDMGQGANTVVSHKEVYHQLWSELDLAGQIELVD